jgi:hypothetical protein
MADATTTSGTQDASATDQVKDKAQQATEQVRDQAQQAAGQARGRLRDEVDSRSTQAGQQVSGTADDLRSVAESLRSQGQDKPAQMAEKVAERAQRLGGYLEESDADRILGDVEDFARRQPWVVGLGAAALGFAAARFMKASSAERYESTRYGEGTAGGRYSASGQRLSRRTPGNGSGSYGETAPGATLGGTPSAGV